jgi:hypothetical protein
MTTEEKQSLAATVAARATTLNSFVTSAGAIASVSFSVTDSRVPRTMPCSRATKSDRPR